VKFTTPEGETVLDPFGGTGEVKTVATGKIVNTGTGSPTQGNYRFELRDAAGRVWKRGYIEGFPRKRLLVWDLMRRALKNL